MNRLYPLMTSIFFLFFSSKIIGNNPFNPACIVFTFIPADELIDCSETPFFGLPTAIDTCCFDHMVIFSKTDTSYWNDCDHIFQRSWIATSNCANSKTFTQTIIQRDMTPPSFVFNSPILANANSGDTLTFNCDEPFLLGLNPVTAVDNCDPNPTLTLFDGLAPGNCLSDGYLNLLTCIWVAEDSCGNRDTFKIFVEFVDIIPPIISCPADTTLECDQPGDPAVTGIATGTDNCAAAVTISYSDDTTYVTAQCEFSISRSWVATDDCGNSSTCVQTIYFVDTTAPQISCPADTTLECDQPGDPSVTGSATGTDNCTAAVTISYSDDTTYVTAQCEFSISRTWVTTDDCGNSSACIQTIHFVDTTFPEITFCPSDVVQDCSESTDPSITGFATAIDNCDVNVDITFKDDTVFVNGFCDFIIFREWKATDDCGNFMTCIQTFKLFDHLPPALVCPNDITIECTDSSDPPNTGLPEASDNCDPNLSVDFGDEILLDDPCTKIIKRTWTATDDCGNSDTCSQIITIIDTLAPVLTFIHPDLVGLNNGDTLTVECSELPVLDNAVAVEDNCDDLVEIVFEESVFQHDCTIDHVKAIMNCLWIASDACGNTDTLTLVVRVVDTTAPVIQPTDPMIAGLANGDVVVVACENISFLDETAVTVSDNCDGNPSLEFSEVVESNDCTVDGLRVILTCRWTATDICGNSSFFEVTFKVIDDVAPVISGVPDDITVNCAVIPPVSQVEVMDNCDPFATLAFKEDTIGIDGTTCALLRQWTATDDCGNTSVAEQVITIPDCVGCFGAEAVYFIDFNAILTANKEALLLWRFTPVSHQHLFLLERSFDNEKFESVGIVEGRVNFNPESVENYSFVDKSLHKGFNFYRVKAVNAADLPIYTQVEELQLLTENTPPVFVFPNPVKDELTIDFTKIVDAETQVQLLDGFGQVLQQKILPAGIIRTNFLFSDYPSGIYFVKVQRGMRKVNSFRIVKMK